MEGTRTPKSICETCGHILDAVSLLGNLEATPNEGDVSLCISCGALAQFNDDLTLRPADDDVLDHVAPRVQELLKHAQQFVRARGRLTQKIPESY